MEIDDLYAGRTVRIIIYDEYRPDHWAPEMDEWQDCIVTISEVDKHGETVWIEEDEGAWEWKPWDFEFHHNLKVSDPNMRFKTHRYQEMIAQFRTEVELRHKKEKIS